MASSYAIVICHGSYHTPTPFQPFVAALQGQGIEAYCPQLPTSDLRKLNVSFQESSPNSPPDFNRPPPPGGYPQPADDALVINELLDRLIEKEGKNVVLLGHSAGGFVATYVAKPKYQRKVRQASDLPGGLVGIVYVCAFIVPVGESVHSFFQPKDGSPGIVPPFCRFHVGPLI
jgi:pimeloyl-ACP methyl ester carboxylesterase